MDIEIQKDNVLVEGEGSAVLLKGKKRGKERAKLAQRCNRVVPSLCISVTEFPFRQM